MNNRFTEAFMDEKLSDRMLPSFILVRNFWLEGLFNLIESFADYNHKLRRYSNVDLNLPYDRWVMDLVKVYLYFRSQLVKEVVKNPKNKYSEVVRIMEQYIEENISITYIDGKKATLLLNDFAHEIGLTEVTNERRNPNETMKTPF